MSLTKANTRMLEGNLPISQVPEIPNTKLANDSITINGSEVALGGSTTIATGGTNTPYFYATKLSDTTLSRGTQTVIGGFTNNELDSDNAFDGQTFTVPSGKAGIYYFHANLMAVFSGVGNDGELLQINFKKNGSVSGMPEYKVERPNDGGYRAITGNYSIIQSLAVGDTMEITAVTKDFDASGDAPIVANASHFMGFRLVTT